MLRIFGNFLKSGIVAVWLIIHDGIDIEIWLKLIENCDFERIVTIALRWEGKRWRKGGDGQKWQFSCCLVESPGGQRRRGCPPPHPPPRLTGVCTLGYSSFICEGVLTKHTVLVFVFCFCYTGLGSPICVPFIFYIRQWLWIMLVYVYYSSWVCLYSHTFRVYIF